MSSLIALSMLALALMMHNVYAMKSEAYHAIFKHEEYPNKCVINPPNGTRLVINSEETVRYPGKCAEIYCGRNSWALVYTCRTQYPPKDCEFGDYININASYPDCCPRRIKCNSVETEFY
ncbi:uncharacterized protein LOC111599078 [Drosophila hydei]|uniref:Uncharacterized protein LOC111599078 n=1 Tax=Drosophila hydei TaxID=7224 RepID=A0A6J1LTJ5_DROHY|nr:uncharacterized protein LOC111599078 [Drosophila hydei]